MDSTPIAQGDNANLATRVAPPAPNKPHATPVLKITISDQMRPPAALSAMMVPTPMPNASNANLACEDAPPALLEAIVRTASKDTPTTKLPNCVRMMGRSAVVGCT
jgi:hypothetical protein